MKIRSLKISENKILKDIELDFCNNGEVMNTIVITGENGTGKTTLLESIYKGTGTKLVFELEEGDEIGSTPKIIYFPAEINTSSGEKQLALRTSLLEREEVENSIILIDIPELLLHPKLQERILKIYEGIGKNNQIIVATHSPHVLGSVPKENIIVLEKHEGLVVAKSGEELEKSLGQTANRILEDIMGLETTRNLEVHAMLEEVREMVKENRYESCEFQEKYSNLKEILGALDTDLLLVDMEIQRRKNCKY